MTWDVSPIRLAAVTRKPRSASFEQRVFHYRPALRDAGIEVEPITWPSSQRDQRRAIDALRHFDGVWWHRHLLHPWLVRKLRGACKRLVFDYDDPLIYSSRGGGRSSLARRWRFAAMMRRCDAVITASPWLGAMAEPHGPAIMLLPMAVDMPQPVEPRAQDDPVQLLWVGSSATQPYLEVLRPALEALGRDRGVALRLIAHEPMQFGEFEVDFRPWSPDEQDAALRECHIGLCPMPDTVWTRGKCPYKVLQYMSYAMPWVGSAVGENITTAGQGERGLCATTTDEWLAALRTLIVDAPKRQAMGEAGRQYILKFHERTRLAERLVQFWREQVDGSRQSNG